MKLLDIQVMKSVLNNNKKNNKSLCNIVKKNKKKIYINLEDSYQNNKFKNFKLNRIKVLKDDIIDNKVNIHINYTNKNNIIYYN